MKRSAFSPIQVLLGLFCALCVLCLTRSDVYASLVPDVPSGHLGQLVVTRTGAKVALRTRLLKVKVHVQGRMAKTEVEQIFENPFGEQIEGEFTFRLPDDAVIVRLAMDVDGRLMEGELVERTKARAIYRSIVRSMRDPALLEWQGGSRFRTQIFPIPARGTKRVILAYEHILPRALDGVDYEYLLPTSTAKIADEFVFSAFFQGKRAIASRSSYKLRLKKKADGVGVKWTQGAFTPKGSLLFHLSHTKPYPELIVGQEGKDAFGVLELPIQLPGMRPQKKRFVFLLDTSASLRTKGLESSKKLLRAWLASLPADAAFGVIAGDFTIRRFRPSFLPVKSIAQVESFLEQQKPRGASRLLDLFLEGARFAGKDAEIIYIGDGQPALGEMDHTLFAEKIKNFSKDQSLHFSSLVLGESLELGLLDRVARLTRGRVWRVLPEETPKESVQRLTQLLKKPVLTELHYEVKGMTSVFRFRDGDIASGRSLLLAGQMTKKAVDVTLKGKIDGGKEFLFHEVIEPSDNIKKSFAASFWAKWHINQLEKTGQKRPLIIQLSKRFRVMSRYTSFLVLENEKAYKRYQIARRSQGQQIAQNNTRTSQGMRKDEKSKGFGRSKQKEIQRWMRGNNEAGESDRGPRSSDDAAEAPTTAFRHVRRARRARSFRSFGPVGGGDGASPPSPPAAEQEPSRVLAEPSPVPMAEKKPLPKKIMLPKASLSLYSSSSIPGGTKILWMPSWSGRRGTFWLKSMPSGADVFINNKRVGSTPMLVSAPVLHRRRVRDGFLLKYKMLISIRRCGYRSFSFRLTSLLRGLFNVRLKADPNNPCRGTYLFKKFRSPYRRCGSSQDALLNQLQDNVRKNPLNWWHRSTYVQTLISRRLYKQALVAVQDWRRYSPENASLIVKEADLHKSLGDFAEERRTLSELVEFMPQSFSRRRFYAQELERRGNLTSSCRQLALAVRLNPAKRSTFRNMMDIYRKRYGQLEIRDIVQQCVTYGVSRLPVVRDLSVVLFWDDPSADIDLHVREPQGETVFYRKKESSQGGTLYWDITNGLGPEVYVLGSGKKGSYRLSLVYFSGNAKKITGKMVVLTQAGGIHEKKQVIPFTLHLKDKKKNIHITTIELKK